MSDRKSKRTKLVSKRIEVIPLKAPLVKEGDNVVDLIQSLMLRKGLELKNGDVVAIADKVLAISEGRVVDYRNLPLSKEASELASRYGLEAGFAQVVLNESEKVYGGVYRAILTLNNGIIMANAGVDHKNAPIGKAALWPKNPDLLARRIREELQKSSGKSIAVIIVDSKVNPMRRGTVGIAIGSSGVTPVIDCRGMKDLFGKSLKITFLNIVDDLASMAHLAMGEVDERTPIVLIRNAPIRMDDQATSNDVKIREEECLIMRSLEEYCLSRRADSSN